MAGAGSDQVFISDGLLPPLLPLLFLLLLLLLVILLLVACTLFSSPSSFWRILQGSGAPLRNCVPRG